MAKRSRWLIVQDEFVAGPAAVRVRPYSDPRLALLESMRRQECIPTARSEMGFPMCRSPGLMAKTIVQPRGIPSRHRWMRTCGCRWRRAMRALTVHFTVMVSVMILLGTHGCWRVQG